MCAISGLVDVTGRTAGATDAVAAMNDAQGHRGPDGAGIWSSSQAVLGHRRLAVIDPEHGQQPRVLPLPERRGELVLTYNGELYNFRELRAVLRRAGHGFTTGTDTEVLLAAWAQWGPRAVEHLNGIFAFAVWDSAAQEVWLVRDHLGVKPLHYHRDGSRLLFASEPKGILAHPEVATALDADGLRLLSLPLLKVPGTSPFAGIEEVPPGSVLRFGRDGTRTTRYWSLADALATPEPAGSPAAAADEVRALLEDVVARQTISDVPLATFLSGGLDSSVITALTREHLGADAELRTFSVDFSDAEGDPGSRTAQDRLHARLAADHLRTTHHNVVLDADALLDPALRLEGIRARDLPNGFGDLDTSLLTLCRRVKEHASVALSGEAADEVLGGYLWFTLPEAVGADTFPWIADTPAHGRLHPRQQALLPERLRKELDLDAFVADEYRSALASLDLPDSLSPSARRQREITYLATTYFLPLLLDRNDRLSMAAGLEARVPFCDHRLVEALVRLPEHVRRGAGREKAVLRDAIGTSLPTPVRERRKSPYPTSPDPRYATRLRTQLTEVLSAPPDDIDAYLDAEVLRPDRATSGAGTGLVSNYEAEVVLNLAAWLEAYRPALV
ncbi:asparagine synthase (glutamine-hydrolyzing) [Nocardioides zeae]|uniref:asparagine synthase (glutamine-hydrolyzing) n=1 Tax=Nocardioides zeae TaxID=1457234 RepID=A0AAJ1TVZ6_9ACTN|nr:asparagine synthase (glutamine-hydrolyzing) [Nocardioides zeae]MDQ1103004.1 asparagine synthase (glutamine-hydrolyzing) [Nocardioides zeae]